MTKRQTEESFWARVDRNKSSCWEWQGSCNSTGYGTVAWHGKVFTAHRIAAYLCGLVQSMSAPASSREPIHVLHKCDNRKCCNPDHLFLGSYSDNQADAYKKQRRAAFRGESHTNAKLTNYQAEEIRTRYTAGETQTTLAKTYGVSQRVISLITRKETYI